MPSFVLTGRRGCEELLRRREGRDGRDCRAARGESVETVNRPQRQKSGETPESRICKEQQLERAVGSGAGDKHKAAAGGWLITERTVLTGVWELRKSPCM